MTIAIGLLISGQKKKENRNQILNPLSPLLHLRPPARLSFPSAYRYQPIDRFLRESRLLFFPSPPPPLPFQGGKGGKGPLITSYRRIHRWHTSVKRNSVYVTRRSAPWIGGIWICNSEAFVDPVEIELRRLLIGRGRAGDTPRRYDGVFAPTGTTSRSNRSPVEGNATIYVSSSVCSATPRHATHKANPFPLSIRSTGCLNYLASPVNHRLSILVRYTETNDIDRSIDRSIRKRRRIHAIYIYIIERKKGVEN